jgi:hypothetical protein
LGVVDFGTPALGLASPPVGASANGVLAAPAGVDAFGVLALLAGAAGEAGVAREELAEALSSPPPPPQPARVVQRRSRARCRQDREKGFIF